MSEKSRSRLVFVLVSLFAVIVLAGAIVRSVAGVGSGEPLSPAAVGKFAACLPKVPIAKDSSLSLLPLARAEMFGDVQIAAGAITFVANKGVSASPSPAGAGEAPARRYLVNGGSFRLAGGADALSGSSRVLVVAAPGGLPLLPTGDTSYRIVFGDDVQLPEPNADGTVTLAVGTTGRVDAGTTSLTFKAGSATEGRIYLPDARPDLFPQLQFAKDGPARLPLAFGSGGPPAGLTACVIVDDAARQPVITPQAAPGHGADLLLTTDLLPEGWNWWTTMPFVLVGGDGHTVGIGTALVVWRYGAAIIATIVAAALIWGLLALRYRKTYAGLDANGKPLPKNWSLYFAGLFISEDDGEPSLSLFQVFFWTAVTVWALLYTYIVTGSLIGMTPEMMVLLGIAGAGTVAARWIAVTRGDYNIAPTGTVDSAKPVNFWDILSTKGRFDLLKLQLLIFTLLIGLYVVSTIAQSGAFPVLDTNLLLLMGVSQGLYIGGKVAGSSDLDDAQKIRSDYVTKARAIADKTAAEAVETDPVRKKALGDEIKQLNLEAAALKSKFDDAVGKLKVAPLPP